jgi:hypothetical protein
MPEFNSFNFGDLSLPDFGSPSDYGSMANLDVGSRDFNLDNFLTELSGMGTDLGPSSSMGMDSRLLDLVGLSDLGKETINYDPNVQGTTTDPYKNFQTVGSDRIQLQDDGSAVLVNENGEVSYLTQEEVERMNANKLTNTYQSGYNTSTGGDKYAPGGGSSVTNANGSKTITMPGGTKYLEDTKGNITKIGGPGGAVDPGAPKTPGGPTVTPKSATPDGKKGMDPSMMMMLMLLLSQMGKGGGSSSGSQSTIPALTASRSQLPYSPPSRPGAGGTTYFSPTTYAPRMAGGGIAGYADGGGISSLGSYSDGGRLLKGPGDGVSDSIPATIGGDQEAALADGEFVVPARIVSEIGNGSTEAGARKLYAMMDRVQNARRKTENVAADTKASKYLPA